MCLAIRASTRTIRGCFVATPADSSVTTTTNEPTTAETATNETATAETTTAAPTTAVTTTSVTTTTVATGWVTAHSRRLWSSFLWGTSELVWPDVFLHQLIMDWFLRPIEYAHIKSIGVGIAVSDPLSTRLEVRWVEVYMRSVQEFYMMRSAQLYYRAKRYDPPRDENAVGN